MKNTNPFIYSDDNKRYYTWNYYLRHRFHEKVYKVALNSGLTCPNRDGTCGVGGCTFCGSFGSGEFAGNILEPLPLQFKKGLNQVRKKRPNAKAIAYFQAYTNTYTSLANLKSQLLPFLENEEVAAISIATRADCLEDDKISFLAQIAEEKEIWIELGLQSIHNPTAKAINRGHTYEVFEACINKLSSTKLKICVHLINSLPHETPSMMIESARKLGTLPIHALKIHMLHIMKNTVLGNEYEQKPFPLMERAEYVDTVIKQLEVIPNHIILQRLTGDGDKSVLLAPLWTTNKKAVLNEIDKQMVLRNTWQGKRFPM